LFLSTHAATKMLSLTRIAERFIGCAGKRRLYATTEMNFEQGQRWLKLLGFEQIKAMPGYGADGSDHLLFSRSIH
jgi:hypothetical protein